MLAFELARTCTRPAQATDSTHSTQALAFLLVVDGADLTFGALRLQCDCRRPGRRAVVWADGDGVVKLLALLPMWRCTRLEQ
jgi:hypothetical protein